MQGVLEAVLWCLPRGFLGDIMGYALWCGDKLSDLGRFCIIQGLGQLTHVTMHSGAPWMYGSGGYNVIWYVCVKMRREAEL